MKVILHPGNKAYKIDFKMDAEPILFEVEKGDIYDIFKYNSKYFTLCGINHNLNYGMVKETKENPTIPTDHDFENELICPYCGAIQNDMFEHSDNDGEIDCQVCGTLFKYQREIEITYSSKSVKCPKVHRVSNDQ